MPRLPLALAAAAAAASWLPAHAAGAPAVSATPSLKPAFRTGTPDYTVRCRAHKRVRFAIDAPAGTTVTVGHRQPRSGRFTAHVKLVPGQAVVLRSTTPSRDRVHYVRCLPKDFPSWRAERTGQPQAEWYVVTPSRNTHEPGYVVVFDSHGVPVWWMKGDPPPFNGELLPDGNLAWTRWVFVRTPPGYYEEHALDGSLVRRYDTRGFHSNPHELRVLPDGTAFMVAYRPRDGVDLSRWGGPSNATVLDGEVQELDPSGKLVWSWSSRDHVALSETRRWFPKLFKSKPVRLADGRSAYDIAHVNSIEPAGDEVVVSLRHTDAVYAIDRATGRIAWKLGGTKTARRLRIVGDRFGSKDFGGQHDARVLDGGRTITVFDNGSGRDRPPRALAFKIDAVDGTARLVRSLRYAKARASTCCGGARRLPGGDWVVSWGNTPYVTEQNSTGRAILTIRFGGGKVSYRANPILPGTLSRGALRAGMDAMVTPR